MTLAYWLNYYPDVVAHGKMWDQTVCHWLLAHKPYSDQQAFTGQLQGKGAIVVIPGRYHMDDVDRINEQLDPEPWVVYVVTSDEENVFNVDRLTHRNRKVWVQTPKPGRHDDYEWLPVGWTPHAAPDAVEFPDRELDWFFAGQITHPRRQELAEVLRGLEDGWLFETKGFTQGMSPKLYTTSMLKAKVVPCPSGPVTVDTFRLWEALQAGCVPVVEMNTPAEYQGGYWDYVLGDHPLPVVEDWGQLPEYLATLTRGWALRTAKIGAWYVGYKRDLYRKFWQSVKEVSG